MFFFTLLPAVFIDWVSKTSSSYSAPNSMPPDCLNSLCIFFNYNYNWHFLFVPKYVSNSVRCRFALALIRPSYVLLYWVPKWINKLYQGTKGEVIEFSPAKIYVETSLIVPVRDMKQSRSVLSTGRVNSV